MKDLVEFLLARIAEDEEVARAATPGPWATQTMAANLVYGDPSRGVFVCDTGSSMESAVIDDAVHIARWDPARVLAECEAKRGIVEAYQLVDAHARAVALTDPDETRNARNTRAGLQVAMQALALPYADHPDYRQEWRP